MAELIDVMLQHTPWGQGIEARCRVRIYGLTDSDDDDRLAQEREPVVVIITELPDNPGKSVTNAMEWIATVVVHQFDLDPARTRWIEHYPDRHPPGREGDRVFDESFSLVSLGWEHARSPWGQPSPWASGVDWQPLTQADVTQMLSEVQSAAPDGEWHCAVCSQPIHNDDEYFECASCDEPLCTSCGPGHCPQCLQDKGGIGGGPFRLDA